MNTIRIAGYWEDMNTGVFFVGISFTDEARMYCPVVEYSCELKTRYDDWNDSLKSAVRAYIRDEVLDMKVPVSKIRYMFIPKPEPEPVYVRWFRWMVSAIVTEVA